MYGRRCVNMTDEGACAVVSCTPMLQMLSVYGTKGVTDKLVDTLAASCAR